MEFLWPRNRSIPARPRPGWPHCQALPSAPLTSTDDSQSLRSVTLDLEHIVRCVALRNAAIVDHNFLRRFRDLDPNYAVALAAHYKPFGDFSARKLHGERNFGSGSTQV